MDMEKSLQRASKEVVPDWNNLTGHGELGQLAQPHVQFHFPQIPVSDHLVAVHGEDTNGVHFPPPMSFSSSKPRWGSCEYLESFVRQATCRGVRPPKPEDSRARLRDYVGHRKVAKGSGPMHPSRVAPKRSRCESEPGVRGKNESGRGGGAAFNTREDDLNTIMTTELAELEGSLSQDESESEDEVGDAGRGEMRRSNSQSQCPQSKAATTHNISEQRRRDRIDEKMKALQKLVPNSSKTDKASMLDEVIAYTKQLQGQVEMMKLMRSGNSNDNCNNHVNIPQMMNAMMMMPAAALPPQQLQMSLLARMGAGLGLGMLGHGSNVAANNAFVARPQQLQLPPHFLMPQTIPSSTFTASQLNPNVGGDLASMPLHDPYVTFLAQKMNMDNYYNKLAALHQQQTRHPARSDKT